MSLPSYTQEALKSVSLEKFLNLSKVAKTSDKSKLWSFQGEKARNVLKNYKIGKTVNASEAVKKFHDKDGFFISLFTDKINIDGFHQVKHDTVKYQLQKLGELAKDHKDVYLLDEIGSASIMAANMLETDASFNGKNIYVIKGGIFHWVNENGPVNLTDPQIDQAQKKILKEVETDNIEGFYKNYFTTEEFDVEKIDTKIDLETGEVTTTSSFDSADRGVIFGKILKNAGI